MTYLTLFDLKWIALLAGVLLAAVVAMTIQTARTRRLAGKRAAMKWEPVEAQFRALGDALSTIILFIDRDERCHYSNRAFQHWRGRSQDMIDGLPLHTVVGDEIYRDLKSHGADALAGKEVRYGAAWARHDGRRENLNVTLLPFPPGRERASGFHMLIERAADSAIVQAPRADDTPGNPATVWHEGETVYVGSMAAQLISGNDPLWQLLQALEQDQFILFAQKIMPVVPGVSEPRCVEILLRLQEEEQYMLPPGGFFPVAEHYGLMGEIDRWVVRNLLKWCAARQRDNRDWLMPLCCVNLSSAGLCDAGFPLYVQSELERYGIPGNSLCFEIAEMDVVNHHADVQTLMAMLKPRGCRFTADSFGSVRVSFTPFKDLGFDFLKIDGIIVQNILRERSEFAKTVAIVMACQKIGIRCIAESVESADMLTKLREIGVDYVQGFGIGKPGPLVEL